MHVRRLAVGILAVLAIVVVSVGVYFTWTFAVTVPRTMSDFAALWNTTDALTAYVYEHREWPRQWKDLSPIAPIYDDDDLAFAEEHVDVNFGVDLSVSPNDNDWCVRVKSGRIEPEQQNANQRICNKILTLQ